MRTRLRLVLASVVTLSTAGAVLAAPAVAAAPTVTSFSPTSGGIGTTVTITGTNFASPSTVVFGASSAVTASYLSATKISAVVPSDATSGPLKVTTSGGTTTSTASFGVTPSLAVSPLKAPPGGSVPMKGAGYGAFEAVDVYVGTTDVALVTTDSAGRFATTVQVPITAVPGPLWISAVGRRSGYASQKAITVQTDWPQTGGGASHPFVNMRENAITQSTVGTLDTNWTFPSGQDSAYISPVMVGGIIYWSTQTSIWALNEASGAVVWRYNLSGSDSVYNSSLAVVGGNVYFGTAGGKLVALRAYNGSQLWSVSLGSSSIYSSPAVMNGVVYVGAGSVMFAVNASTGATVWQTTLDGSIYPAPAVSGGRVFIGSSNGTFYALSATNGGSVWTASVGAGQAINGGATVTAGVVYVNADDGKLHAYAASTGNLRWTYSTAADSGSIPAVANGLVYTGDSGGGFYAVNAANGTLAWSSTTGGSNAAPTVANGLVFTTGRTNLTAFYASYGGVAWAGGTSYDTFGSVTLVDGHLLVPDNSNGSLVDFEPSIRPSVAATRARPSVKTLHANRNLRAA